MKPNDELLAALRRVAAAADGPPSSVLSAARAAFAARDLDGELAVLVADSHARDGDLAYEPVRGVEDTAQGRWLLSFSGGGVQVDMEVAEDNSGVRLYGQFHGTSNDDFVLESAAGSRHLDVDELGRFIVDGVAHGPVRLRCRASDGTRITTVWLRV